MVKPSFLFEISGIKHLQLLHQAFQKVKVTLETIYRVYQVICWVYQIGKKRYTRYINNMWQSPSIYVAFINNAASAYRFSFNGYPSFFKWQYFYLSTALAVLDICKCTVSTNLRFMWSYLWEGEVPFYVRKGAVFSHPPARSTQ